MDAPASGPAAAGIRITLPDGSERRYAGTPTGAEIAASIGKGLAKAALAIRVDGELRDLSRPLEGDARIEIVTRDSAAGIDLLRHDAAHVMAEAVKGLYPDTQVTIGPPIENGFYYDFYRQQPFSSDDLAAIEARMREIVRADAPFTREEIERGAAIALFRAMGEEFKAEIIQDLPPSQTITIYRQGAFFDLCRGPHSPSVGRVGQGFKLMRVAGAYWRGDSSKAQLQRIYGTAWADEKQLAAHLHQLEEAEKRDHRRLGRDLDLFHQQEEAVGAVFWHPKGWRLYRTIEEYLRVRLADAGYQEVRTPQLLDRSLWERSGHWDKFHENMFIVASKEESDKDSRLLALKPMNCPGHIQIFRQGVKSYRDLPLRYSEFGACHRNEPSGSLSGIMRVRAFTQDDAHIFCTEEQITAESKSFCDLLLSVYKDFGFESVRVKFSDRPERRAGTDAVWDRAEGALRTAIEAAGLPYAMNPGEGAFYGPKLEFVLSDAIGRDWQCGTLQVDFVLPERLDAEYTASDGSRRRPVMLHRAIFGSFERFIGILIENYAGRFPLWLAPLQVVVASITEDAAAYASEVKQLLAARGLRVAIDNGAEKINYKVRMHSLAKVPVLLVVGRREQEQRTVTVRRLGIEAQESLALEQAAAILCNEAQTPSHKATAQ